MSRGVVTFSSIARRSLTNAYTHAHTHTHTSCMYEYDTCVSGAVYVALVVCERIEGLLYLGQ